MKRKNRKGVILMAALLSLLVLFLLTACTQETEPEPEPIDGGTTTHIDANAPKAIESKDITAFSLNCYLSNRWRGDEERFFRFKIEEENGVLTASEERSGISRPADAALLTALQEIIDKYELVKNNGIYKVTAGLPPEFQESTLFAGYASGETLTFTRNNEPAAEWAEDIYDLFADWFAANGDETLRPAKEETLVTRLDLRIREGAVWTEFGGINVQEEDAIDGQTYLLFHEVYDEQAQSMIERQFRLFPEDYYESLTAILADHDAVRTYEFSYYDRESGNYGNHDEGYYGFGSKTTADGEEDSEDLYVDLYVEYESGRRMTIETRKASEIEGLQPLLQGLQAYLEPLFAE
ncbi:MAG: hypothetical protein IKW92_07050 [Firmicutes bacterium]|nr:hypothetical protein [Bacillota bacterium]